MITTFLDESLLPNRLQTEEEFNTSMAYMVSKFPLQGAEINQALAAMNSIAAGGGLSLPYTFSTATTDSDPGQGNLRLSSTTQNAATVIRLDTLTGLNQSAASVLNAMDDSTSVNKGQLRLVKTTDPTKWLVFNVLAVTPMTGYYNLTVSLAASSTSSPFFGGDDLTLHFTRTGDQGPAGTQQWRTGTPVASTSSIALNQDAQDMSIVTALAVPATLTLPTGVNAEGRRIMYRIKDNGTARALSYNAIFNASADLALPLTTIAGKDLYLGFIYNAVTTKWTLLSLLHV